MNNPFDVIDARLSNIETLLLNLKHGSSTDYEPMPESKTQIFGVKACSRLTGYSASAIYARTSKGLIPCFRRDGKLLFRRNEIMDWLTENRVVTQKEFSNELDNKLTIIRRTKA